MTVLRLLSENVSLQSLNQMVQNAKNTAVAQPYLSSAPTGKDEAFVH